MLTEFVKALLMVVVGYGLRWLLAAVGVEIDPVIFNTLVAAIVVWILGLLGLELAARTVAKFAPRFAAKHFTVK